MMSSEQANGPNNFNSSHRIEYILEGHQEKLLGILHCQWLEQSFCDLQLRTTKGVVHVHACVVVAFSPRLATAVTNLQEHSSLRGQNCKTSVGYSVDVLFDHNIIKSIMESLYSGVFSADADGLDEITQALEWLGIEELVNAVQKFKGKLKDENLNNKMSVKRVETASHLQKSKGRKGCQKSKKSKPHIKKSCSSNSKYLSSNKKGMNLVISLVNDVPYAVSVDQNEGKHVSEESMKNGLVASEENDELREDIGQILQQENQMFHFSPSISSNNEVINSCNSDITSLTEDVKFTPDVYQKFEKNEKCRRSGKKEKKKRQTNKEIMKSSKVEEKTSQKSNLHKSSSRGQKKKNHTKESISILESTEDIKNQKDATEILVNIGTGEFAPTVVKTEVIEDEFAYLESSNLQGHALLSGREKDRLKCNKCHLNFTDVDEYEQHIKDHPTYTCEKCYSVFFSITTLCRHVRQAHLKAMHLKCSFCEFKAIDHSEFSKHCIDIHQEVQPFRCQFEGCKFRTTKYRYLSKHFENHENFRIFKCDKCEKVFRSYNLLHSHKRSCYHLQSYLCDLCGQSFNHAHSMKIHRRTMHFGEKPFKCKVCSKSFSNHANLRRHMRIHDSAFPYPCSVCGKKFRHSNTLKSHMNKHGGMNDIISNDIYSDVNIISQDCKSAVASDISTEKFVTVLIQPSLSQAENFINQPAYQTVNYTVAASPNLSANISVVPSTSHVSYLPSSNPIASMTSVNAASLPIADSASQENIHLIQRLLWNHQQDNRFHS